MYSEFFYPFFHAVSFLILRVWIFYANKNLLSINNL